MIRKIIHIDQEKCNGCGACAAACHEGAIGMVDGKARLMREDYCDGLGDCLPACPVGAIRFEEREAAAYDRAAVMKNMKNMENMKNGQDGTPRAGCPGSALRQFRRHEPGTGDSAAPAQLSRLRQWPVQIQLVPVNAPFFAGAHLLVAADCTAYACASFHQDFIRDRVALIGCPKLDGADYAGKLGAILSGNDIRSLTVVRMEVPCCGGLEHAAAEALRRSGKPIPWRVAVISIEGQIMEKR